MASCLHALSQAVAERHHRPEGSPALPAAIREGVPRRRAARQRPARPGREATLVQPGDSLVIEASETNALFDALRQRGYGLIGPTLRDGAIVLDEIAAAADLPVGWTDEQDGGHYRVKRRDDGALFGHAVGPHSWKRWLHPPSLVRWRARRENGGFVAEPEASPPPQQAFVGVRPCELAAILVQDRVFLGGPFVDPAYRGRREAAFVR